MYVCMYMACRLELTRDRLKVSFVFVRNRQTPSPIHLQRESRMKEERRVGAGERERPGAR